jgi:Zinc-binding dehydrogenase
VIGSVRTCAIARGERYPSRHAEAGNEGAGAKRPVSSLRGRQKAVFFIANFSVPDMEALRDLLESGQVKPAVDNRYDLGEVADALRYMGEEHAQGKLVINTTPDEPLRSPGFSVLLAVALRIGPVVRTTDVKALEIVDPFGGKRSYSWRRIPD